MHYFPHYLILFLLISFSTLQLTAQEILTMPTSGDATYTGCNALLYDNGGTEALGTLDSTVATYTIYADQPNSTFQLDFLSFGVIGDTGLDSLLVQTDMLDSSILVYEGTDISTESQLFFVDNQITTTGNAVTIQFDSQALLEFEGVIGNIPGLDYEILITCSNYEFLPTAIAEVGNSLTCNGNVLFSSVGTELDAWDMTYAWDFGDGSTSNEKNPTHIYTLEGNYDVSLEVCNQFGCSNTVISVNYDPINNGCFELVMPETGNLTQTGCGVSVLDSGGTDGTTGETTLGNASYTIYSDEPNSVIQVEVVFFEEATGSGLGQILLDIGIIENLLLVYDGADTTATVLPYTDNKVLTTGDVVTIGYNGATLLEVIDIFGGFEFNYEIVVTCVNTENPPVADFELDTDSLCAGFSQFLNLVPNIASWNMTYNWDFGDGTTSTEANPTHSYETEGAYQVSLEACNQYGCSDTTITVTNYYNNQGECFLYTMNPTLQVINSCFGVVYDSGGPNASYEAGENYVMTLENPTGAVGLTFNEFEVEVGDLLKIYDGPTTSASLLLEFTGEALPNDGNPISSTGNTLTLEFTSDQFGAPSAGWEAEYFCISADFLSTVYAFVDENENSLFDGTDYILANQSFTLEPSAQTVFTNLTGQGVMLLEANSNYTVSYVNDNPLWEVVGDSSVQITTGADEFNETITFPVVPVIDFSANRIDITSAIVRCNQEVAYWVTNNNVGTSINSGFIELVLPHMVDYAFANIEPDSVSMDGDKYYWFFEDLYPGQSEQIVAYLQMPGVDFLEEDIVVEANVENWNGLGDNKDIRTDELLCAYDPNDKLVEPFGYTTDNYTTFDDTLEYTVRFQNTGNDTAFNVVILDTLNENVDLKTFDVIASSHNVNTTLYEAERIVEFSFPDIYLPDSNKNEPGSHGFVRFNIQSKNGLPENTGIDNTAHIYFDFNPAIVTNTVNNTMVTTLPTLPVLGATPFDLSFVTESNMPETQILTIQNSGDLPLEITGFTFDNEAFSTTATTLTIEGGGSAEIEVLFTPSTFGESTGTLNVQSLNSGSLPILLSGNNEEPNGIQQVFQQHFKLFPNPNEGQFYLENKTGISIKNINVYNYTGQLLLSLKQFNDESVKIDLKEASSGIYFIEVKTSEGILIEKVIIN